MACNEHLAQGVALLQVMARAVTCTFLIYLAAPYILAHLQSHPAYSLQGNECNGKKKAAPSSLIHGMASMMVP